MRPQAAITALQVAFVTVLAVVLGHLVMLGWESHMDKGPQTPTASKTTPATAPLSVNELVTALEPLVGKAQRPHTAPSPNASPSANPQAPVPEPGSVMSLEGTIVAGAASVAFVQQQGKDVTLHLGDEVSNFKVKDIRETSVLFSIRDEEKTLWLPSLAVVPPPPPPTTTASASPAAVGASPNPSASPNSGKVTVAKSERDATLQNPQDYMTQMRILPFTKDGRPYGVKVTFLKPGTILTKMGMQQDDILLSVNGRSLFQPDEAINAYMAIKNEDHVQVQIDRGGKLITTDVEFQ